MTRCFEAHDPKTMQIVISNKRLRLRIFLPIYKLLFKKRSIPSVAEIDFEFTS